MDGGKIGRFNFLIVLLAKPYIKGFKPIPIHCAGFQECK
jgi:hypothetical protein